MVSYVFERLLGAIEMCSHFLKTYLEAISKVRMGKIADKMGRRKG